MNILVRILTVLILFCSPLHIFSSAMAAQPLAYALPSLQSYTGLLNMPTARILPDWHMRFGAGGWGPYRYYGSALGVLDRLEFHGQFTSVNSMEAFSGEGYGSYKDRSAGARLVLLKEGPGLPQVAVGAFDATGTAKFGMRYIALSKVLGDFDFTLGLGQGIMAGESENEYSDSSGDDQALGFLTSNPFRKTDLFGGFHYTLSPDLVFAAEYSPLDWSKMFGFQDSSGKEVKEDTSRWDVNLGLKYRFLDRFHATLAWMRGAEMGASLHMDLPLDPEGLLTWKRTRLEDPGEKQRFEAAVASNDDLAGMLAETIHKQGFTGVRVTCADTAVWVEYANTVHLSESRAVGHVGSALLTLLPVRITTIYLNTVARGGVVRSMCVDRERLACYLNGDLPAQEFLDGISVTVVPAQHDREFSVLPGVSAPAASADSRFSWSLDPRIRTFLNNRAGFFKHKGVLELSGSYRLWPRAYLSGSLELTVFNQYDDLVWTALEDDAVRTDLVDYERQDGFRVAELALTQLGELPGNVLGRVSAGCFESAYAGVGAELFRYFYGGMFGMGVEAQAVRKRDVQNNFALRDDSDDWYTPAFVNVYAQLWPSQGVEGGLKIGRFLAGDPGVRFQLQRSFKYFTLGGWYTRTNTDIFKSAKNRNAEEKGVFIRIPFSLFKSTDVPGSIRYSFTSFTRDQGQTVSQPYPLFPVTPWETPVQFREKVEEMKRF